MPINGRMTWYQALSIVPEEPLLTAEGEAVALVWIVVVIEEGLILVAVGKAEVSIALPVEVVFSSVSQAIMTSLRSTPKFS